MKTTRLAVLIVAGAVALTSGQILANQDVRHVPDRDIPVPATVSPATQAVRIGMSTQNRQRNGRLASREAQMGSLRPFPIYGNVSE
jgi:hypothetical protein